MGGVIAAGIALNSVFTIYFVPTVIAAQREHRRAIEIGALNFLLGWTVLGWIIAFIWSLTSPSSPQTIIVQTARAARQSPGDNRDSGPQRPSTW